jgi:hypothetical protein
VCPKYVRALSLLDIVMGVNPVIFTSSVTSALCYELSFVTKVENNCWEMKIMSSSLHRFYFTNDPDRGALCSSLRLFILYVFLI